MAEETLLVMDALGIGQAALWGHSDGAVMAAWVGFLAPTRVRALVLEALQRDRGQGCARWRLRSGRSRPRRWRCSTPATARTPGKEVAARPRASPPDFSRPTPAGGPPRVRDYFGMRTVSITWMTPFDAMTSAFTTVAPSTMTLSPLTAMVREPPWSVLTLVSFTRSLAVTLPATTW